MLLVALLSTISFFLPSPKTARHPSPRHQFFSSIHTIYQSLGIQDDDEFGLTSENDLVRLQEGEAMPSRNIVEKTVGDGELPGTILASAGLAPSEIGKVVGKLKQNRDFAAFAPGKRYEIETDRNGRFVRLSLRADARNMIHLEKDAQSGTIDVWKEALDISTRLTTIEGTVRSTLSKDLARLGRPGLAATAGRLLFSQLGFGRDLEAGSTYRILFEEQWVDRVFVGTGRILALETTSGGHARNAYLFTDTKGGTAYYDRQGNMLLSPRIFIQPCTYSRITSDFGYRIHPIRRTRHFHGGVDFAAPVGTPVRAASDGKVMFRGRNGGAGNMLTIAHAGGLYTQYLHLSRFSPLGMYGNRVRQGDIIGYVGSTGSSTGPHLDFRVIRGATPVNPIKALALETPKQRLPVAELGSFIAMVASFESRFSKPDGLFASVPRQAPMLF